MRNMTDDEMKKLWKQMQNKIDDDLVDALRNGNWRPSSVVTSIPMVSGSSSNPQFPSFSISGNLSPTDKDAQGRYEYQEPEVDEQGTYYGYKVLHKCTNSGCRQIGGLISPRYQVHWSEYGELQADYEPYEKTMFGIHFTKRPDHPELRNYMGQFTVAMFSAMYWEVDYPKPFVLVKCALSGTIVETEQGFRAEHAQIVGVYSNGNGQSYQDYQERTRAYTRPNPYEKIRWEPGYWKADWDTSPDTNP